MSIPQPSQYDCNQMDPGDIIYIKKRGVFYKWYREHFSKNKIKIKIRKVINNDFSSDNLIEYYQEDCVLIFEHEIKCKQILKDSIPYVIYYKSHIISHSVFPKVEINLANISLKLSNDISIVFPVSNIASAIGKVNTMLNEFNGVKLRQAYMRNKKYKGDYFKQYVIDNNITEWIAEYCHICGKPIFFRFYEDGIEIDNTCECHNYELQIKKMTYDEFAAWYASITNEITKKRYDDFWIKKE